MRSFFLAPGDCITKLVMALGKSIASVHHSGNWSKWLSKSHLAAFCSSQLCHNKWNQSWRWSQNAFGCTKAPWSILPSSIDQVLEETPFKIEGYSKIHYMEPVQTDEIKMEERHPKTFIISFNSNDFVFICSRSPFSFFEYLFFRVFVWLFFCRYFQLIFFIFILFQNFLLLFIFLFSHLLMFFDSDFTPLHFINLFFVYYFLLFFFLFTFFNLTFLSSLFFLNWFYLKQ